MNTDAQPRRLLWNEPAVVALCGVTLLVTVSIIALQLSRRAGLYDPQSVPIFDRLFLFNDFAAAWVFLAALLAALVPSVQRGAVALARWFGRNPGTASMLTFVLLAAGAKFAYLAHPLAMDEAAPFMQSRIFASGALLGSWPAPLVDWLVYPPFQGHFIQVSHQTGHVASAYWPGFALLLTPFSAAGVPWLCNPVLGALSIWVVHRLSLELTDSAEAAGSAILFMLASGAFVVNSISYYSMTAHLLCSAVYVLLLMAPTPRRALAAGLVGGLALTLHNPVPHILFAAPWLIWVLVRRDRLALGAALAAGYLPWIIIAGFGWHQMTQALVPVAADGTITSAIGPIAELKRQLFAVLRWPTATLLDSRMVGLAKLWLWAAPSVVLLAFIGYRARQRDRRVQLLLASAVLTFVGFLFVPVSQGHGWGFRYFHSAWFVVPLFAAMAIGTVRPARPAGSSAGTAILRFGQGAALCGLVALVPFFLLQTHRFIGAHLDQLPSAETGTPRVVIVSPMLGYYAQDLVQNDPFLRDPVVRVITHGRRKDEAMLARHFPDLTLLARDYRGSVWGYPADGPEATSGSVAVGREEHRQQE